LSQQKYDNILTDYKIIKNLGEGGMGEVYLATDLHLARKVAIKFLKLSEQSNSDVLIKRFQNEAKILASLNHPNIISVYNFGIKNNINFIIMEFVDGINLQDAIKGKRFDFVESTKILKKIVRGMSEAHEKGVLHRDIKPANIIISHNKEVKIVDFGISKNLYNDENKYTKDNHLVGTVNYMAPEIFLGHEPSVQSDIFSIGVLYFEMLTGINPYTSENKFKTIEKIKTTSITLPTDIKSKLPFHLNQIFNKMIAIDPSKRYKSANEIYKELRSLNNKKFEDSLVFDLSSYQTDNGESTSDELNKTILSSNKTLSLETLEDFKFNDSSINLKNQKRIKTQPDKNINVEPSIYIPQPIKPRWRFFKFVFVLSIIVGFLNYSSESFNQKFKEVVSFEKILASLMGFRNFSLNKVTVDKSDINVEVVASEDPKNQSIDQILMELPEPGAQFTYEIKIINERTGKVFKSMTETYQIKNSGRQIASFDIKNNNSKKIEKIKVTANSFLPPFEYTDERGKPTKLKITGNYDSIYPLATGNSMEYTAIALENGGSFQQTIQQCKVLGKENLNLKSYQFETYVVQCKEINQNNPSETWTYYSPKLKQFVKKEIRKHYADGYHLETINLIGYKMAGNLRK
jgi:serine/threonine protein kinase